MTATTADSARQDAKILGLVSTGHFCSHFYLMCLPPLFYFLNQDLGISYTEIGLMVSLRTLATGVAQVPAGILVDRYGAKLVLTIGLALMVFGYAAFAFASAWWLLVACVVIGGIGDSVFHPADYAILNASVSNDRIARAFSIHTFSGHLGFAVAPAVIPILASLWNWRVALLITALFGFIIIVVLITQWNALKDDAIPGKKKKDEAASEPTWQPTTWLESKFGIIASGPVLALFGFFAISTLAGNGISSFGISAMMAIHHTPEALSGVPITAYMLTSAFAVLLGGVASDKLKWKPELFAAVGFLFAALTILAIGLMPLPYVVLIVLFGLSGFCLGVIRPARDLMVRDLAPKGQSGKVFGFVFSGQNVGGALAPVMYGLVLDNFAPQWVFYISAICLAAGILTVVGTANVRASGKQSHT
jgi:FSR family fosmidomycin resistance protein-like MFS transporter